MQASMLAKLHCSYGSRTLRRMVRSALSLTICIALTLATPTSRFLGTNSFLIATVAIYLFPKSTISAQLLQSSISYLGFLLGLAWYNIIVHISVHIPEYGDRILLYFGLLTVAWVCGYVRSRFPISYLGINFAMLVNIFGLVEGIRYKEHSIRTFNDFFYVFTFGTLIALGCSLLWPENTGTTVENQLRQVIDALEACDTVHISEKDAARILENSNPSSKLEKSYAALIGTLKACKHEVLYTKLSPKFLSDISVCLVPLCAHFRMYTKGLTELRADITGSIEANLERDSFNLFEDICHLQQSQIQTIQRILGDSSANQQQTGTTDLERGGLSNSATLSVLRNQYEHLRLDVTQRTFTEYCSARTSALIQQVFETSILICSNLDHLLELSISMEQTRRKSLHLPLAPFVPIKDFISNLSSKQAFTEAAQPGTKQGPSLLYTRYWLLHTAATLRDSPHTQYAIKFSLMIGVLGIWPFIDDWSDWYFEVRGFWAMVFGMVVMETTRGLVIRTAMMKIAGAVGGGLLSLAVFEIASVACSSCGRTSPSVYFMVAATFVCGLLIYFVALNARLAKAGTVSALAFSLVLSVGFTTGNAAVAYMKRLSAQLVGILVAVVIHICVYPYHARHELKQEVCGMLDDLAFIYHDSSQDFTENDAMIASLRSKRASLAQMIHFTSFEPSLKGHFPKGLFREVLDEIINILDIFCTADAASKLEAGAVFNTKSKKDLHQAVARQLYLSSHAMSAKQHTIIHLMDANLTQYTARLSRRGSSPQTLRLALEAQQTATSIENLRKLMHEIIAGRSLPILLELAAQSPSPDKTPGDSPLQSRRGSLAVPSISMQLPPTPEPPVIQWEEKAEAPSK